MAHTCVNDPEMFCLDCEKLEAESVGSPRICEECGEQLPGSWPTGFCQECERKQTEEQAETFSFVPGTLLAVVFLCVSAFGQSVSSGSGFYSGFSSWTMQAGAPLTYNARFDPCVTGAETGCAYTSGHTGQAGSPLSFLGQTGDPMPWYQTPGTIDRVNTAITDPDFGSYQVMLTSGTWGNSIGFGTTPTQNFNEQAGEWDPFSQDDSLLLLANNEGGYAVVALDVSLIHSKGCAPQGSGANTSCVVWTGIKTGTSSDGCTQGQYGTGCTILNSNGEFSFSRVLGDSHVIYELMATGSGALVQVNKLLVTCPSGAPGTWGANPCSFTRTPYVNFTSDYADPVNGLYPTKCSALPPGYTSDSPWTGAFSMANDGTVGYAAGGAADWQASTAYVTNSSTQADSFIYPLLYNSQKCAFQVTTAGTSGSIEPGATGGPPAWTTGTGACTVGATVTDGSVTWTNIGKIGGQDLGFDVLYYSPARGCRRLNTRTAQIYNGTNEGPNYPSTPGSGTCGTGTAQDCAGQVMTDSVSAAFNICMLQYDDSSGDINTGAPGFSNWPNCQTSALAVSASNLATLTDVGTIHDGGIKMNSGYLAWTPKSGGSAVPSGTYQAGLQSCRGSGTTYRENICNQMEWQVNSNIVRPIEAWVNWPTTSTWVVTTSGSNPTDIFGGADGHEISGFNVNWKSTLSETHDYNQPNANSTSETCFGGACSIGSAYQGNPLLQTARSTGTTGAPWDEHGADRAANTTDTVPAFLFNTAVPAMGRTGPGSGYPGHLPGYNEITGMAVQAVAGCTSSVATYCQWRFAHNWGTGSVGDFNGQNEQGMNSQDGTFAVFATDVMGTRGSISPDWIASKASSFYTYGFIINPLTGNANHSSYQNLTGSSFGSGTSANEPNWSSCQTSGQTCTDTSVTPNEVWTNVSQPASGNTGQLPCNGLRGDYEGDVETSIAQNATVFPVTNNPNADIFKAVSCTPISPATSCSFPISEGTVAWSGIAFGATGEDSNGINWQNIGPNDCRTDVVLVDLMSAQPI